MTLFELFATDVSDDLQNSFFCLFLCCRVRYGVNLETGERVAIKIIDFHRFNDDTTIQMRKEIKILRMLHHENIIKIIDVKEDINYTGVFCENCACTCFRRLGNGICGNCQHLSSEHSDEETRSVWMIAQELAAGGELFGLLMHTGAFSEEVARYYFRQLIAGLEYCHALGVCHRDLK